ncbi:TerB family tellurite resistance protein [Aestuariibacter halophilus]|uniref:TerB family tellurite resistance protein n=1 Tax=Fluctibacter halophilus TaxID=226011 RepID=A0ABS8GCX1_9ALTE|nr:TerB family tellurite resistance protein [Aestuariibacter halophilus]MCC2618101.1 TerB family tellurite resistance protein [Aestuariibacter halophilus]
MDQQAFNEALMKLCILLYQADGKITLKEQDYFYALQQKIDWQGEEDLEDFQRRAILEVRDVLRQGEQKAYVSALRDALSVDAKRALAVAQGISHIDGDMADEEVEILDHLQNRVLAKSLSPANDQPTQQASLAS